MRGKAYVVGVQWADSRGITGIGSTLGILEFGKFRKSAEEEFRQRSSSAGKVLGVGAKSFPEPKLMGEIQTNGIFGRERRGEDVRDEWGWQASGDGDAMDPSESGIQEGEGSLSLGGAGRKWGG